MEEQKNVLTVPVAIIVAGALIAAAVLYTSRPSVKVANTPPQQKEGVLAPVTAKDHIIGNPNAKIVLVEFSDTSCPYCKAFHPTMKRIIEEYGKSGNVAWVYRHFPLDKPDSQGRILHPNAGKEAEALECAAELGGNAKFWEYTHKLYEVTPSVTRETPKGLDPAELPKIAKQVGLNESEFTSCLASGKYEKKVEDNYLDGVNAGVLGTPFTFAVTESGEKIPINGAQSYSVVKGIIDALLDQEK
jgi:protein-disulfide isomerase